MSEQKTIAPDSADLREAMDKVMARVTLDDIAQVAGCSVNTLKQTRLDPMSAGYRNPPPGLRQALLQICRDRAQYFAELAKLLRPSKE